MRAQCCTQADAMRDVLFGKKQINQWFMVSHDSEMFVLVVLTKSQNSKDISESLPLDLCILLLSMQVIESGR